MEILVTKMQELPVGKGPMEIDVLSAAYFTRPVSG